MPEDADIDTDERISLWGRYRRRRFRRRSIFWRWRRLLFLLMLVVVAGLAGIGLILSRIDLPPADQRLAETSFICTREVTERCGPGTAAAQLNAEENRVVVPYRRIPRVLIQAVIAAEDQHFWEHNGVDPAGIARAGWAQITGSSESTQGGSTITQQYVKIAVLRENERTVARKIREAIYALELERELTKREILERYLNTVYFGRGAYGVQAAAQAYFFKDVDEVSLTEAAYLAGLIRAPESADADRNPQEAYRRRDTTLVNMAQLGFITQQQLEAAEAVRWTPMPFGICANAAGQQVPCPDGAILPRTQAQLFSRVKGHDVGAEYYYETVRQQLVDMFGEDRVYTGGLRVYTALDLNWQRQAYETVLDRFPQPGPESSIVAVGDDGRVRAMMAGRDFNVTELNLAMGAEGGGSGRQPGSSFKPYALAEALAQGYSAQARVPAPSCVSLEIPGDTWDVCGGGSGGGHTLLSATAASSNVVFAQLMLELGPENVVDMAHKLGVDSELPVVPALVLGSGEVSVLDMASAFTTFREHGVHREPVLIERVEDSRGNVLYSAEDEVPQQVISPEVADTVTTALRGVTSGGTGTAAQISGWDTAGKTGTTQNNKDAWFVGYTCKVTAAVWVGNVGGPGQEIAPLGGQGGTLAAPTWQDFQQRLIDNGLVENDCSLAEVTDFPGRTSFEDLDAPDSSSSSATCPDGYTPADLDGDGVVESCVEGAGGASPPPNTGTVPPPPTAPPPTAPPPTPPPTTAPPPPTVPGPALPGPSP